MGSKSEAREARKALKKQQFEESKDKLIEKVQDLDQPRYIVAIDDMKSPAISPRVNQDKDKIPKATKDASRFNAMVTWCISNADLDGKWSWHELRKWSDDEWSGEIDPTFRDFSQKTWAKIDELASGSGHKMHHEQEVYSLIREARRRWKKLGLEEFETAFRFRLGGTKRAWGYIVQAHFFLVWWERHHKIYPVER